MPKAVRDHLFHFLRLAFVIAWYTLAVGAVGAMLQGVFAGYDETALLWQTVAGAVACVLIFFYTVRAMVVRDPLYASHYHEGAYPLGKHLRTFLATPLVWCDLACVLACQLIGGMDNPLQLPIHALSYVTRPLQSQFYAYVLGISFPLFALTFFLAHVRARGKLRARYAQAAHTSRKRRSERMPPWIAFVIACVEPTLLLALLGALLPLVFSVVMLLVKALGHVTVWIVIGVITVYLLLFRYTRAIVKRKKFHRELVTVAQSVGDEVILHRPVWASLFVGKDTPDFTLWHKGRRYDGVFLHSLRKYTPMVFDGSGVAAVHRIYRLRRVELFRTVTVQRYAFESEGTRVIIVLPTPKKLIYTGGGAHRDVDAGDRIDGYSVFNATGFLRAIERDCLDRGETFKRH